MERLPPAAAGPEWTGLPAGVLQLIFSLASAWTAPGSCLAAPVCRPWRSAATGCSGIRLLYHAGDSNRDASFKAWLGKGSRQLESLILTGHEVQYFSWCLGRLARAAAAAAAAGHPLSLQILRVVGGFSVSTRLAGQLLAGLPHLRCLQLGMDTRYDKGCTSDAPHVVDAFVSESLAPLKQATQLQELYLRPAWRYMNVGQLLPLSLQRLSGRVARESLSHLTQLTFLQSKRDFPLTTQEEEEMEDNPISLNMPTSLQTLEVDARWPFWSSLVQQKGSILSRCDLQGLWDYSTEQQATSLPKLRAASVRQSTLFDAPYRTAALLLEQLSSLEVYDIEAAGLCVPLALLIPVDWNSLKHLDLRMNHPPVAVQLASMEELTRLGIHWHGHASAAARLAWSGAISELPRLRWLSVPAVLLAPEQAWLGCLQQLQVLVLQCDNMGDSKGFEAWLAACSPQALPPQLQLLGLAYEWGVRGMYRAQGRRLQQLLSSSGCEVVVGGDLEAVLDSTQQLAGLPAALKQALE